MKLFIFSGFLGSGKTKLILSIAKEITLSAEKDKTKLVILENEIGETGIDDKILNSKGYNVQPLLSGCICCTLKVELIEAINQIMRDIAPEYIIFEPTGVAKPENILDNITKYGYNVEDIKLISVADASRWNKLMKVTPNLIHSQMQSADLILINKCDLVSDEVLSKIELELSEWNPDAEIHRVVALNGMDPAIWDRIF
jgi:G3E family GTPase